MNTLLKQIDFLKESKIFELQNLTSMMEVKKFSAGFDIFVEGK